MKCTNCGTDFNSKFCPECGCPAPVSVNAPVNQTAQANPSVPAGVDVDKNVKENNYSGNAVYEPPVYTYPGAPVNNIPNGPVVSTGSPVNIPEGSAGTSGSPVNVPNSAGFAPGTPVNSPGIPGNFPGAPVDAPTGPQGYVQGGMGAPVAGPQTFASPVYSAKDGKKKKLLVKHWWFWLIIAIVLFVSVFAAIVFSENFISYKEVQRRLRNQDVRVTNTYYLVQDDEFKVLSPDMLQAVIMNNSNETIENVKIAFVAWDQYGDPVKIIGRFDFFGGNDIMEVDYEDISLEPGKTFGSDHGLALSTECDNIDSFEAIVVSYETDEGEVWNNPVYNRWCTLLAGKKKNTDN